MKFGFIRCRGGPVSGRRRPAQEISVAALLLLSAGLRPALAQQAAPIDPPYNAATPMYRLDMRNPGADQPPAPPSERPAFIEDAKFNAQLKTFYFNRDKYDNSRSEAWALGGSATFRSGYLADLVRVGAVAYTSQPLYAPSDRDGTL